MRLSSLAFGEVHHSLFKIGLSVVVRLTDVLLSGFVRKRFVGVAPSDSLSTRTHLDSAAKRLDNLVLTLRAGVIRTLGLLNLILILNL